MGTPIRDAVEAYLATGRARFHMPGHKGRPIPVLGEAARYDITEVDGCDSLYEAGGAIAEAEALYSELYGTAGTLLCAGGSTLCIQTMLALGAKPGSQVICGRGVHTAALSAMALLDLHPVWIFPAADPLTGLSAPVTAGEVEAALAAHPDASAVYITSPSYLGMLCDVAGVAAICHRHGVPLLVDNAHGAHLRFLAPSRHPMDLGADLCCDSLHKTLPVLTGGAALHVRDPRYLPDAKRKMSLFGSTSPSYLILLSADGAIPYLREGIRADLVRVSAQVAGLEAIARERGFLLPAGERDPCRLTLGLGPTGLADSEFRAHLAAHAIEPELCNGGFCVFLAAGATAHRDYHRLTRALRTTVFRPAPPWDNAPSPWLPPEQAVPLRQAMLAPCTTVALDQALNRVSGSAVAPCPPGIPLVVPGERINKFTLSALKSYGILSINVLKLG